MKAIEYLENRSSFWVVANWLAEFGSRIIWRGNYKLIEEYQSKANSNIKSPCNELLQMFPFHFIPSYLIKEKTLKCKVVYEGVSRCGSSVEGPNSVSLQRYDTFGIFRMRGNFSTAIQGPPISGRAKHAPDRNILKIEVRLSPLCVSMTRGEKMTPIIIRKS